MFLGEDYAHTYQNSWVVKMAAEDATIEACNLFSQLAISKTTTIEEVVSKNYGSWRALLTLMKEIRQDDTSKFSKLDLERIANLSVGFHQWGTRQLKERSPMFSDEFKRFVSSKEIVEILMDDLMGSARSKGGDENNEYNRMITPNLIVGLMGVIGFILASRTGSVSGWALLAMVTFLFLSGISFHLPQLIEWDDNKDRRRWAIVGVLALKWILTTIIMMKKIKKP